MHLESFVATMVIYRFLHEPLQITFVNNFVTPQQTFHTSTMLVDESIELKVLSSRKLVDSIFSIVVTLICILFNNHRPLK